MKQIQLILAVAFVATLSSWKPVPTVPDEKMVKLTVSYAFKNIEEGYDHETKTEVYIDGRLMATSDVHRESKPAKMTVMVSKGRHSVRIINYALYNGNWEALTIENNYSQNCTYETSMEINKSHKIKLTFDLDNGTIVK